MNNDIDEEEVGETLHWSDEEDELEIDQAIPISLPELRVDIAEYNAILQSLKYRQTADITLSIASRAHMERLIDQYWDLHVKLDNDRQKKRIGANEQENEHLSSEEEIAKRIKTIILNHPHFRSAPLLLRWPILAADVPKPTWTLADEVIAIMERHKTTLESSKVEEVEMDADAIDASLALPSVLTCQHALLAILQDMSLTANYLNSLPDRQDQKRDIIITWRDVLKCISSRRDVPDLIKRKTEKRLEEIFGRVDFAVPSSWMATIGMGGSDKASKFLKAKEISFPLIHQQVHLHQTDNISSSETTRDLNQMLLGRTMRKRTRYLQPPPHIGQSSHQQLKAEAKERRRKRKAKREKKKLDTS